MTKPTSLTIALALSASLGLAACGSDDDVAAPGVTAGTTDAVATADDAATDETTTEIYTLSLHDALPIWAAAPRPRPHPVLRNPAATPLTVIRRARRSSATRSIGRAHV